MPLQTFRYAACGGINTGLDIVLYAFIYNFVLHQQVLHITSGIAISAYIAAFIFSFFITFPIGFYLSRYVVWQETSTKKRVQLFRYFLVVLACIFLNYVFLKLFIEQFGWFPTPSKIVTSVIVIAFSYVSQRHFSFKSSNAGKVSPGE